MTNQPNPYEPNVMLEQAALTYMNYNQFDAAAAVFTVLVERQPDHEMAWYGLGQACILLSQQTGDLVQLVIGISCLKRSILQKVDNQLAHQAIQTIALKTAFTADKLAKIAPFGDNYQSLLNVIHYSPNTLLKATRAVTDWQNRAGIVMFLGWQYMEMFTPLLLDVILYDPHPDVVMAALKRIAPVSDQPGVQEALEDLVYSGRWEKYSPYPQLALQNIQQAWARELLAQIEPVE